MPSLIDDSAKATLEPDIILKHKCIGGSGLRNGSPDTYVRARDGNLGFTHTNRTRQIEYVRRHKRLRFDEQLVAEGVERLDVATIE
jgi:hypothetical protein